MNRDEAELGRIPPTHPHVGSPLFAAAARRISHQLADSPGSHLASRFHGGWSKQRRSHTEVVGFHGDSKKTLQITNVKGPRSLVLPSSFSCFYIANLTHMFQDWGKVCVEGRQWPLLSVPHELNASIFFTTRNPSYKGRGKTSPCTIYKPEGHQCL